MTQDNNDLFAAPKREPLPEKSVREPFKIPAFLKWFGICIASVFALLIVLGIAIPLFVDFNALRDKAIAQVKAQTGFDISLGQKIDFTIMPLPKVVVYDVIVRHPSDDPSHPLLKAGEIDVSVGLLGLLSGKIDIPQVKIKDGAANMHVLANGTNNWTPFSHAAAGMKEADLATKESSTLAPVGAAQAVSATTESAAQSTRNGQSEAKTQDAESFSLGTINLSNMAVVYLPANGNATDIKVESGKIGLSGFDGPFDIAVKGKAFSGRLPVDLTASIGEMKKGSSDPVNIKVIFKTDTGSASLDGNARLGDVSQYAGKVDVDFSDLTKLMHAIDPKSGKIPVTKLAIKSDNVLASPKAMAIKNAAVTFDEASGSFNLNLQGLGSNSLTGNVTTDMDVSKLALAKGFKNIKLNGTFSKAGDVTRIAPMDLVLDGQNVKGVLAFSKSDTTVDLTSDRIDLAPILQKFNVKNMPDMTLNGLAVRGRMAGQAVTLTSLTVNDVSGMKINASGGIRNIGTGEGATLKAVASSANVLASLRKFPQIAIPKNAETFLNGQGGASVDYTGSLAGGDLIAKVNAMGGSAGIKTTVTDIQKAPRLGNMTFIVAHPNTNALIGILSPGTKMGPAFNGALSAEASVVQKSDTAWQVSNLNARIGGASLAGNLLIDIGAVTSVSGDLSTGAIDIAQWFGAKETSENVIPAKAGISIQNDKTPVSAAVTSGSNVKWSSAPIDVTWMRKMAMDLNLKSTSLTSTPWVISNPTLKINLANGSLKLSDISGGFMDGTIAANASIDADINGVLNAKGDMKASGLNLDKLTRALAKTDKVVDGSGALDLNATARGSSPKALISSLNGSGTLGGKSIVVYGVNVDNIVDAVNAVEDSDWSSALQLTGSNFTDGSSKFSDASIPLTIANGVLSWPETKLTSVRSAIVTKGTLDFPDWIINVANDVVVTTKENRVINALQITTTGSMDKPQTKTDSSAITNKLKERAGKLITKKLGDKLPAGVSDAINGFLGVPAKTEAVAPAPVGTTVPVIDKAVTPVPAETTTPAAEPAPAPTEPAAKPTQEEQIINGLQGLLGQ